MTDRRVLVIGGGIIGLSLGWTLARAGRPVAVFEAETVGRGASWTAAGMLAPDAELEFEETTLHALNTESRRRWPAFADELEADTGLDVGLRTEGTFVVADDRDAAAALRRRYEFQNEQGLDVEWMSGEEARHREPFLAPNLAAAVWAPGDHQVNNRSVVTALRDGLVAHGGDVHEHTPVAAVDPDDERPALVTEAGERVEGETVVVAAGAWSRALDGLESLPIRPVKGQTLGLEMGPTFDLRHVVRGPDAYVVPKDTGHVVVGATSEERGFDDAVTAEGLYENLEGSWEVVPGILDRAVHSVDVGFRPASRDHAPLLGPTAAPGIVAATGHFRHGILLTPVTAQEVARYVLEGTVSEWIEPFLPTRFDADR